MKGETFFEHFDVLAEAPHGVAKLRKLILRLAIQGMLVAQDPNDEPTLTLLEQIAAQKRTLLRAGITPSPIPVNRIAAVKGSFNLPSTWAWVRFGEIVINRDGERIPVSKEVRISKAKNYDGS